MVFGPLTLKIWVMCGGRIFGSAGERYWGGVKNRHPCMWGGKILILGVPFLGGVTGEQNPYNDGRRHSKYRSLLLINGCDKKMKLIGGDTKV